MIQSSGWSASVAIVSCKLPSGKVSMNCMLALHELYLSLYNYHCMNCIYHCMYLSITVCIYLSLHELLGHSVTSLAVVDR